MTVSLHARFRFASAFDLYERMYCVVMLCSTWQYKYDCMEIGQWAVRGKRHTHTHTHAITQVQTVFNIYLYRIYSFLLRIFVILLVRTNKHDTKFPKKNRTNVIGLVAFSMRALLYPMIDY